MCKAVVILRGWALTVEKVPRRGRIMKGTEQTIELTIRLAKSKARAFRFRVRANRLRKLPGFRASSRQKLTIAGGSIRGRVMTVLIGLCNCECARVSYRVTGALITSRTIAASDVSRRAS